MPEKNYAMLSPVEAALAFGLESAIGPGRPCKEVEATNDLLNARHGNEASQEEFHRLEDPDVFDKIATSYSDPVDQLSQLARALRMAPSHDMHLCCERAVSEIIRANPGNKALSEKLTELLEQDMTLTKSEKKSIQKKGGIV